MIHFNFLHQAWTEFRVKVTVIPHKHGYFWVANPDKRFNFYIHGHVSRSGRGPSDGKRVRHVHA